MYQNILCFIARLCTDHYRWVVLVSVLLTIILGALAMSLTFNLSFLAILPDDDEIAFFKETTGKFGGSSDLLLVVQPENRQQGIEFAEAFAARMDTLQAQLARQESSENSVPINIRAVDYKIDHEFVEDYGLLFVDDDQLHEALSVLRRNQVLLTELYRDLHLVPYLQNLLPLLRTLAVQGMSDRRISTNDRLENRLHILRSSLDLLELYLRQGRNVNQQEAHQKIIEAIGTDIEGFTRHYLEGGYFFSSDSEVMLIYVQLTDDVLRIPLGIAVYRDILRHTEAVAHRFPGLQATYTGLMAMGYEDQNFVLSRFRTLSTLSLVLVILLFYLISRSKIGPVLVAVALLMAMTWTFGMVKIGLGFVSLSSLIFAVLLFGLGIDFAIHVIARYNEELAEGNDPRRAISRAITGSGRSVVTGGLTTAGAFFTMMLAADKSAVHLGYTTGWGVIWCLLAMVITFPALLYWRHSQRPPKNIRLPGQSLRLLEKWVRMVSAYPQSVLLIATIFLFFFGYQIKHFRMEYNLEKIIVRGIPSVKAKQLVQEKFGRTNEYMMIVADSLSQDRQLTRRLENYRIGLPGGEQPLFAEVLSLSQLLPPAYQQRRRLLQMYQLQRLLAKVNIQRRATTDAPLSDDEYHDVIRLLDEFDRDLKVLALDPRVRAEVQPIQAKGQSISAFLKEEKHRENVQQNLGYCQFLLGEQTTFLLDKIKKMSRPVTESGAEKFLDIAALPDNIKGRFINQHDNTTLILAYPQNASYDRDNIRPIRQALDQIAPGRYAGVLTITERLISGALYDFPLITGSILLVLIVILMCDFRRLAFVVFSLLPLIFSGVISLGIICMTGMTISVLMLVAFPLIFGIGIDDGVHILHRYLENGQIIDAVSRTGRAILFTTITTMVSFGVLLFTNHNGLIAMAILVGTGVSLCFVFSVTILPAVLVLREKFTAAKG